MNNKTVLIVAVILAFATGFVSSQMLVLKERPEVNVIYANGTKIMALNDGNYYPVVIKEIENANSTIHIVMYEMKWYGEPENDSHEVSRLGIALVKAHKRGVDVKIILEDGKTHGYENRGIGENNTKWKEYFESRGIEVRWDGSGQTTHDKLIIIDGKIVVVGSTNWSTSALKYNHEANVLLDGKEVAEEYDAYFETLWSQAHQ